MKDATEVMASTHRCVDPTFMATADLLLRALPSRDDDQKMQTPALDSEPHVPDAFVLAEDLDDGRPALSSSS